MDNKIKRVAIIGSGISGMASAYFLAKSKKFEVTLFEKNDYLGGHTNTVYVGHKKTPVDTGFIVFNDRNYPNFTKLLQELGVKRKCSNMSFSFSDKHNDFEYNGESLYKLFCQGKNIFKAKFYRLIIDIIRFNAKAKKFLATKNTDITIRDFIKNHKFGTYFTNRYLIPLASAIWSTEASKVFDMPARFIIDFYENHGLLNLINRPQWYVILGGSQQYVKRLVSETNADYHLNEAVLQVKRTQKAVTIVTDKTTYKFDAAILACHSDQALSILEDATDEEINILSKIQYTTNKATLHTDINALPKRYKAWASWNYINTKNGATLTYNMNKLQGIDSQDTYCVSINNNEVDPKKIIKQFTYSHPLYNQDSVAVKRMHTSIQGGNRTYYVGAYWGNGFHEDGVVSAIAVSKLLGVAW